MALRSARRPWQLVLACVLGSLWLVPALGGCGVSKDTYRQDMDRLTSQIEELEEDKARLHREKDSLGGRLDSVAAEKGRVTDAMLKALERVKELEAIAARRKAVFDQIRASLQAMASAGKLKVVQKRGMLVVEMPEAILFDTGKSDLKPGGIAAVQEMTAALATIPDRRFQIVGHTDDRGTEEMNWKLSLSRAMSVLRVMRSAGMPPQRISVAGYAWFQPDAPNDTEEGRAQNRRIELVLTPNLEELQMGPE